MIVIMAITQRADVRTFVTAKTNGSRNDGGRDGERFRARARYVMAKCRLFLKDFHLPFERG